MWPLDVFIPYLFLSPLHELRLRRVFKHGYLSDVCNRTAGCVQRENESHERW